MPVQPDPLASNIVGSVAGQVASVLPRLRYSPPGAVGSENRLLYSFAIWLLGSEVIRRQARLRDAAINTGSWYHQVARLKPGVRADESCQIIGSARSAQLENDQHKMVAFRESLSVLDIPSKIHKSYSWVLGNINGDCTIRLLECPSLYLHCFWLIGERSSRIVPISMPSTFRIITIENIYQDEVFLDHLRKEPVVNGLGPESSSRNPPSPPNPLERSSP